MWYFPEPKKSRTALRPSQGLRRSGNRAVALVVVLSLIVIVCLILVAFVAAMSMDRTASAGYSQSLAADQIGQGALRLVVAELGNEMGKDAAPDLTYPNRPLFTNVTSTNILPQFVGTNSAMPNLVKISTATNFYRGTLRNGGLVATTNSTAAPAKNGRYVDANRWNAAFLGSFPSAASLPNWVIMTRGGYTGTSTFGATGDTLNNPALSNTNYAIGRFAYAIYDVGGLLDITVAGHPTTLTQAQLTKIKGTLAGADLNAVGITNPDALVNWRNATSAANASTYLAHITNFVATNGFSKVAPGDTTFLSRQDLIKAAQQNIAGLSTGNLTNLTTFTREKNAPSWGPQATIGSPVGNTIDYAGLAKNLSTATNTISTNFFLPYVRHTSATNVTTYRLDGSATNYPVVAGDPLVSRRFPLGRIKWVGPNGPQNGGTAASIQACFGLLWDSTTGMWKYVGPTGTAEQSRIKMLSEVATEHREPNFFELLQAGILSGSLAMEAHTNAGAAYNINMNYYTIHEKSPTLHVFRIGASIITQAQESVYPIVIEYDQSGQPWQAVGVANLPYLNMMGVLSGKSTDSSLQCYMVFGLSNPHQMPQGTSVTRPPIRLRVKGHVTMANNYGRHTPGYARNPLNMPTYPYSYTANLNATVMLSTAAGAGVNGFVDPHAILATDLATPPGPGTAAGMEWTSLPAIGGTVYAGYRLPDYIIDKTDSRSAAASEVPVLPDFWANMWFAVNTSLANPFNCWLEFQNPAGVWVPYNYHAGINNEATWFSKSPGFYAGYLEKAADVVELQPIDPPAGLSIFYYMKYYWETVDPRSLRFNYTQPRSAGSTPAWRNFLKSSLWSSATDAGDQIYGRTGLQVIPYLFGLGGWNPASLSRNNTPPQTKGLSNGSKYAAYADPDGVQRIADSGLFPLVEGDLTTTPKNSNWQGDPMALSTDRVKDRPIVLNRPFSSVADLGYTPRDYPWRTLDFFTDKSADAGLLDIFTIEGSDRSFTSGRVNLNSRNQTALTAVLAGTSTDVVDASGSPVSKPAILAESLVNLTATTPLTGRDQISTKFQSSLAAANFTTTASNKDEQNVKTRREGITRALADVGQTRTWNLMIDVVAQAGRYPVGANATDQFVVEGERRFWLHVAIDRFTGEVVDQQIESVSQ